MSCRRQKDGRCGRPKRSAGQSKRRRSLQLPHAWLPSTRRWPVTDRTKSASPRSRFQPVGFLVRRLHRHAVRYNDLVHKKPSGRSFRSANNEIVHRHVGHLEGLSSVRSGTVKLALEQLWAAAVPNKELPIKCKATKRASGDSHAAARIQHTTAGAWSPVISNQIHVTTRHCNKVPRSASHFKHSRAIPDWLAEATAIAALSFHLAPPALHLATQIHPHWAAPQPPHAQDRPLQQSSALPQLLASVHRSPGSLLVWGQRFQNPQLALSAHC